MTRALRTATSSWWAVGPAGLAAARAAGRTGARVMLVDDDAELGGALLSEPSDVWSAPVIGELRTMPEVRVLSRATAFGYYDGNCVMVAQRLRLWQVRGRIVILATGAHQRPPRFAHHDPPRLLLARAIQGHGPPLSGRPGPPGA